MKFRYKALIILVFLLNIGCSSHIDSISPEATTSIEKVSKKDIKVVKEERLSDQIRFDFQEDPVISPEITPYIVIETDEEKNYFANFNSELSIFIKQLENLVLLLDNSEDPVIILSEIITQCEIIANIDYPASASNFAANTSAIFLKFKENCMTSIQEYQTSADSETLEKTLQQFYDELTVLLNLLQ